MFSVPPSVWRTSYHVPSFAIHSLCRTAFFSTSICLAYKDLERQREYMKKYLRLMEDSNPVLERRLRRSREWKAARYASDPECRLELNKRQVEWWGNNSQSQNMRQWLGRRTQSELDKFMWKTHVPVIFAEAVRKTCASCGASNRRGSRTWWRRLASAETEPESSSEATPEPQHETGPEVFDCHRCYTRDMKKAMPIGHEDFVFGKGRYPEP